MIWCVDAVDGGVVDIASGLSWAWALVAFLVGASVVGAL